MVWVTQFFVMHRIHFGPIYVTAEKIFGAWFTFRRDLRSRTKLRHVLDTAGVSLHGLSDPAVVRIPRILTLLGVHHRISLWREQRHYKVNYSNTPRGLKYQLKQGVFFYSWNFRFFLALKTQIKWKLTSKLGGSMAQVKWFDSWKKLVTHSL